MTSYVFHGTACDLLANDFFSKPARPAVALTLSIASERHSEYSLKFDGSATEITIHTFWRIGSTLLMYRTLHNAYCFALCVSARTYADGTILFA